MWMSALTWTSSNLSVTVQAGSSPTVIPIILFSNNLTYNIQSLSLTLNLFSDSACSVPSTSSINNGTGSTNSTGYGTFLSISFNVSGSYYYMVMNTYANSSCAGVLKVINGPAAFITFTTQPSSSTIAGSLLSIQPTILLTDLYGNVVPGGSVGLTPFLNPGCTSAALGSLTGNTQTTNASGMTVFTSLYYNAAQMIYIKATVGALSVCSTSVTVSVASAYYLNWTTPVVAGSVVAGNVFSTNPVLILTDYYGNVETGQIVSLYLYSDSYCTRSAGTVGLAGNSSTTNSSGYSTFSSFQATTMGSYYVQARAGSVNSSCSTYALTVIAGSPASIIFTTQPGGTVSAGTVFTTQPVLVVKDVYGNLISGSSVVLTAFKDSGCVTTGRGLVTNSIKSTLSNGVASFVGLSYNAAETVYIYAAAGTISVCASSSVVITASTSYYLNWTTSIVSSSFVAGIVFSTQPVLVLTDYYGDIESGVAVSLNLYTDRYCTSAAVGTGISGFSNYTNSSGYAAFTSLYVTLAGTYFMQATSGSLNSSCSLYPFSITSAPPSSVLYLTQPAGTINAGELFTTQPIVNVKDVYGNAVISSSVSLIPYTDSGCQVASGGLVMNGSMITNFFGTAPFTAVILKTTGASYIGASAGMKSLTIGSALVCSANSIIVSAIFTGVLTHVPINLPTNLNSTSGAIPPTSFLITDSYGNAVAGKAVVLVLYSDSNCTTVSSQAVISGNVATSNSSGFATFESLKISTAGSYFVGTTVGGVQSQCALQAVTIANSVQQQSSSISQGAIAGIAIAVGVIFLASVAIVFKVMNLWPFKRRNRHFPPRSSNSS